MAHQTHQACIEACNASRRRATTVFASCLREQDDVKMMARCIALDADCAAICRLAAGYMGAWQRPRQADLPAMRIGLRRPAPTNAPGTA